MEPPGKASAAGALRLIGIALPVPQRADLQAFRRGIEATARLQLSRLTGTAMTNLIAGLVGGSPDDSLLQLAEEAAATRFTSSNLSAT